MRLNNRGSLAHGGTNPSLTNGSSSRMRGEREEQKEGEEEKKTAQRGSPPEPGFSV